MPKQFFEEQSDQSIVKARIVQHYFAAWANIVVGTANRYGSGKIAYIDLYAGPGRYKDGAASTPILVLEEALKKETIRNSLVALFNDVDDNNSRTLQSEIDALPGIENMKYKPVVRCNEVGKDAEEYFETTTIVPSFTFFDPFGYKGLSLCLVNGVIKDWGCDCVFFFNYNRINMGLSNDLVKHHLDALFSEERAAVLRSKIGGASPFMRQELVLQELTNALIDMGGEYVLPFRFQNENGRPTHHLIFVSKNFKGYEVMKSIMHKQSSTEDQGVASFAYSPADESMPLLFELTRPLQDLEQMLLSEYAGQTLTMSQIYRGHCVGRPFISKHYKELLAKLEKDERISVTDPNGKRGRGFPDRLVVEFPKEKH